MDKDTKDVLVAIYNKLWDNINNKDSRLWTFLSIYGGTVAVTFTVGRVANVDLYASLVIMIFTLWALFIVANASWWDLRNRLMIGGIERKLPDAMRGVVPRSYYIPLGMPNMEKLNDASVMVLALVALTMYVRVMWPFFRQDSLTSWEVLFPLVMLYLFVGVAAWWWVDRMESIVQEYYQTARQLREEAPPLPVGLVQLAQNGSPVSAPLEAAIREAADAVALAAETATNAVPPAERPGAAVVSDAARQAVAVAVMQAVNHAAAQLAQVIHDSVQEAASAVGTAAAQAAQLAPGQGAPAAVAEAAANRVASAVDTAVSRQLVQQDLGEFDQKEKKARSQLGWRVHVFVVLLVATAIFDIACWNSASFHALGYIGIALQTVAAIVYICLAVRYYCFPGTDLADHHLRLLRETPDGRRAFKRDIPVWVVVSLFLTGAAACAAGVCVKPSFPLHAVVATTPSEIRAEREKLADQIESVRKMSLEIEAKLRKEELADFLRKTDADRFLSKEEANQTYAHRADVDAIRRALPEPKAPKR